MKLAIKWCVSAGAFDGGVGHAGAASRRYFMAMRLPLLLLLAVFFLSACKIALHRSLSEEEANQMLSLLLLNKIDAEKKIMKSGEIDLLVDKGQFVEAVEVLRQNGLPRAKVSTMQDIFPSGGLVSSPFEEQAKIAYLKEQQIQKMLSSLNGVVEAQVSVVQDLNQNKRDNAAPSASVYIKYSSQENFLDREASVRSLVLRAVPNLRPEAISVVLEEANIRYARSEATARTGLFGVSGDHSRSAEGTRNAIGMAPVLGVLLAILSVIGLGCFMLFGHKLSFLSKFPWLKKTLEKYSKKFSR